MTSSSAHSDRHLSPSSKVYELVGSRWVDQGTAYCAGQLDDANQAYLVARSELDFNKIILSTAIRSNDVYQRQQGMHTLRILMDILPPVIHHVWRSYHP